MRAIEWKRSPGACELDADRIPADERSKIDAGFQSGSGEAEAGEENGSYRGAGAAFITNTVAHGI